MDKVMCPKGCGEMEVQTCGDGRYWTTCDVCLMKGPRAATPEAAMEEAGRLCYLEIRDRWPTKMEQRANIARYGQGAMWMVLTVEGLRMMKLTGNSHITLTYTKEPGPTVSVWPCLADSRPVAWPNLPTHSP